MLWDEVVVCIVLGSHQIWEITIQSTVFLTALRHQLYSLGCSSVQTLNSGGLYFHVGSANTSQTDLFKYCRVNSFISFSRLRFFQSVYISIIHFSCMSLYINVRIWLCCGEVVGCVVVGDQDYSPRSGDNYTTYCLPQCRL